VVLSEIAPHEGWVEIYNRSSEPIDLKHWSLADATGVATVMLPDVVQMAPNGFVVVRADALNLTRSDSSVALRDPSGAVVDMVSIEPVMPNHSLSRFPVHGGSWTVDTPITAGQFNRGASMPEPSPLTVATQIQDEEETSVLPPEIQPDLSTPWMALILGVFGMSLAVLLALWLGRPKR
jgi:hypothetical protein